ncbi:MAG: hypothetical protein ACRDPD_23735 [Streptosporangiaceae bacterium]
MSDHTIGPDLYNDVLDVLERHGFTRGDDQHAGRALFLIGDLARIYEGSQHHPSGPSHNQVPSPSAQPEPPGPEPGPGPSVPEAGLDAVTLTHGQVRTVLTSLDLAADWKRDHAETCTYCADQSCFVCELRLREARTYDELAVHLLHDEQATRNLRQQAEPHAPPSQPHPAAGKEAGQ